MTVGLDCLLFLNHSIPKTDPAIIDLTSAPMVIVVCYFMFTQRLNPIIHPHIRMLLY